MNRNVLIGLVVALLVAPFLVYPVFLMKILCFALFACAFNLLLGFTGLLSFGHAAFFGGAAYVTGHAAKVWGLPFELAVLTGTAAAAVLGAAVARVAIRRQGIYFAMVTLALAQMVYFFFLQARFTGGENGLQGIPRGYLLGMIDLNNNMALYYVVAGIFLAGFLGVARIVNSPFGQILTAVRENEPRAISLGYDTDRVKQTAFILSAALAGLAGSTKAIVFQLASLTDAHWHQSGEVVLMTLLGGVGTLLGPVVGAGIVVALQNQLSEGVLNAYVPVVLGSIFVVCVLAFRRGVVGEIIAFLKRGK
jgi:branched-chain amino acid transport system permease protein